MVTWAGSLEEAAKGAADAGCRRAVRRGSAGIPAAAGRTVRTSSCWRPLLAAPPLHQTDPGDVAVVVYTAGTTGRPKGAELTHFQLLMNADTPGRLFGVRDDDVVLAVLPLFHVFGLSSILDVCVRFAATMTLVPRFDAAAVLEVIQRDRVTVFEGVPTMYVARAQPPGPRQATTSRRSGWGSPAELRSPPRCSTRSSGASASSSSRATGCPRPRRRRPSTRARTSAGSTASASRSGASRSRSATTPATCCRPAGSTSVSWSCAGST